MQRAGNLAQLARIKSTNVSHMYIHALLRECVNIISRIRANTNEKYNSNMRFRSKDVSEIVCIYIKFIKKINLFFQNYC